MFVGAILSISTKTVKLPNFLLLIIHFGSIRAICIQNFATLWACLAKDMKIFLTKYLDLFASSILSYAKQLWRKRTFCVYIMTFANKKLFLVIRIFSLIPDIHLCIYIYLEEENWRHVCGLNIFASDIALCKRGYSAPASWYKHNEIILISSIKKIACIYVLL